MGLPFQLLAPSPVKLTARRRHHNPSTAADSRAHLPAVCRSCSGAAPPRAHLLAARSPQPPAGVAAHRHIVDTGNQRAGLSLIHQNLCHHRLLSEDHM
ncbi:uncharacterized protein LOC133887612 isoform X1 [Phragmites australis]|uniref:uncharacterized protein LOC133887612 isoform X1 n=1 Tax=Phragmites australis TaxID=29695 RepID=UPI002D7A1BD2|nr:uncharacterized protein LOC133887612 isoform X1 [Phragmites australis]